MGTHLTERIVKAAQIGTRKYVVFDEDCAGFGLCVFLSGRKGFVLIPLVGQFQAERTACQLVGAQYGTAWAFILKILSVLFYQVVLPMAVAVPHRRKRSTGSAERRRWRPMHLNFTRLFADAM